MPYMDLAYHELARKLQVKSDVLRMLDISRLHIQV